MKTVLALAIVMLATPALAGNPQSTGLTHTLAAAQASVAIKHQNASCLHAGGRAAEAMPGLVHVAVQGGALRAQFDSRERAAQAQPKLHATISTACGQG